MRISDWSSDVCSSDLRRDAVRVPPTPGSQVPAFGHTTGAQARTRPGSYLAHPVLAAPPVARGRQAHAYPARGGRDVFVHAGLEFDVIGFEEFAGFPELLVEQAERRATEIGRAHV